MDYKWIILLLSFIVIGSSFSTNFNSCINITQPGYYNLTGDIVYSASNDNCIYINASNVTLNGNGHYIRSDDLTQPTHVIKLYNVSNVTIYNLNTPGREHYFIDGNYVYNSSFYNITVTQPQYDVVGELIAINNGKNIKVHDILMNQSYIMYHTDNYVYSGKILSFNGVDNLSLSKIYISINSSYYNLMESEIVKLTNDKNVTINDFYLKSDYSSSRCLIVGSEKKYPPCVDFYIYNTQANIYNTTVLGKASIVNTHQLSDKIYNSTFSKYFITQGNITYTYQSDGVNVNPVFHNLYSNDLNLTMDNVNITDLYMGVDSKFEYNNIGSFLISINNSKIGTLELRPEMKNMTLNLTNSELDNITFNKKEYNDSILNYKFYQYDNGNMIFDKSNEITIYNVHNKNGYLWQVIAQDGNGVFTNYYNPGNSRYTTPRPLIIYDFDLGNDIVDSSQVVAYKTSGLTSPLTPPPQPIVLDPYIIYSSDMYVDNSSNLGLVSNETTIFGSENITELTNYSDVYFDKNVGIINSTNVNLYGSDYILVNKSNVVTVDRSHYILANEINKYVANGKSSNVLISQSPNVTFINNYNDGNLYYYDACGSSFSSSSNIHNIVNSPGFSYPNKCCSIGMVAGTQNNVGYVDELLPLEIRTFYTTEPHNVSVYIDSNFFSNITVPNNITVSQILNGKTISEGLHNVTLKCNDCNGTYNLSVPGSNITIPINATCETTSSVYLPHKQNEIIITKDTINKFSKNINGFDVLILNNSNTLYKIMGSLNGADFGQMHTSIIIENAKGVTVDFSKAGVYNYLSYYDFNNLLNSRYNCKVPLYYVMPNPKLSASFVLYNVSGNVINTLYNNNPTLNGIGVNLLILGNENNTVTISGNVSNIYSYGCNGLPKVILANANLREIQYIGNVISACGNFYVYNVSNINLVNDDGGIHCSSHYYGLYNLSDVRYATFGKLARPSYVDGVKTLKIMDPATYRHINNVNTIILYYHGYITSYTYKIFGNNISNILLDMPSPYYGSVKITVDVNITTPHASIYGKLINTQIVNKLLPHYDTSTFGYVRQYVWITNYTKNGYTEHRANICFNYKVTNNTIVAEYNEKTGKWSKIKFNETNGNPCINIVPHSLYAVFDKSTQQTTEHQQQQQLPPASPKPDYTWAIILGISLFILLIIFARRRKR